MPLDPKEMRKLEARQRMRDLRKLQPAPITYSVTVLTVEDRPVVLVNSTAPAFVDQVVRYAHGVQANGRKHEWELLEEVRASEPERVEIPVTNPTVHAWMEEKVNG